MFATVAITVCIFIFLLRHHMRVATTSAFFANASVFSQRNQQSIISGVFSSFSFYGPTLDYFI